MLDISDLSCIGKSGKPLHGTAAILYRLFNKEDDYNREAELQEYKDLIQKCGYDYSSK